jgi:hypothetical protein
VWFPTLGYFIQGLSLRLLQFPSLKTQRHRVWDSRLTLAISIVHEEQPYREDPRRFWQPEERCLKNKADLAHRAVVAVADFRRMVSAAEAPGLPLLYFAPESS